MASSRSIAATTWGSATPRSRPVSARRRPCRTSRGRRCRLAAAASRAPEQLVGLVGRTGTARATPRAARANSSATGAPAASSSGRRRGGTSTASASSAASAGVCTRAGPGRAPSAAPGARPTPRCSSTCPTRRASSSTLSRLRCSCDSQSSGRGRSGSGRATATRARSAAASCPSSIGPSADGPGSELGEVVEQRLGRVALAAQLGDRRRARRAWRACARPRRPAARCGRSAAAAARARRMSSSWRAVLVRWSSPRITCVISISASSTAVASV